MPPVGPSDLTPGSVVEGPLLPEPVEVLVVAPVGTSLKVVGKGLRTNRVHEPILSPIQLAQLTITPKEPRFDGDPARFKLGIEALRLGLDWSVHMYKGRLADVWEDAGNRRGSQSPVLLAASAR